MYFGADYHPEHWVYPYAGTPEAPESRWKRDIELMLDAGINVVRMGEFAWGICEPQEGQYRVRLAPAGHGPDGRARASRSFSSTPTAAPPSLADTQAHPEILPMDERGMPLCDGTRLACCLNSDLYWDYSKQNRQRHGPGPGRPSPTDCMANP